jgi:UDP-GlcNAc:undecaprenyl-phosphate/decaprenyl-phosphate GlcNAc-1-phosphate transferase
MFGKDSILIAKILWQASIGLILFLLALPEIRLFYFNTGIRWLYILILSFFAAYFITPFCRFIARRFNILDKPDGRKIHDKPTPLLGGLAIYLAFLLSLMLNNIFLPGMKILLIGGSLIFLMGLWDDIRPLPALFKFIIQVIISSLVILFGDIQLTFFYSQSWAPLINIPLTILWMVGLTNAMNFFDGIDGLATSMSIIIASFLGIIAFNTNQPALGWFSVALVGSCIGFMPHNFSFGKSARLFLGDAGSTFLGFLLAGLAVLGKWSNTSNYVSLTAPILVFSVLIFDMTYVNLSRIKNRQTNNLFEIIAKANKDHLHHRLLFMGFARKEVVFIISLLSICLGVSALIIMNQRLVDALLGLLQAVMILGLIVILMLKGRDLIPREECDTKLDSKKI